MYLILVYKRSFRFSRRSSMQNPSSINWGFSSPRTYNPALHANHLPIHSVPMASSSMEFTRMQESLKELWDSWNRSIPEEGVAVIDRSLVPPVHNALIFRFLTRKSIGVKDLETTLNSI